MVLNICRYLKRFYTYKKIDNSFVKFDHSLLDAKNHRIKVSVKENEVPTEKNSSRASIFATKASYIPN